MVNLHYGFRNREGFNIMLHGFGSKIPVIQGFKRFLDEEWLVITVNELYGKLNARSVKISVSVDFIKLNRYESYPHRRLIIWSKDPHE
jgi:hypothetical protein